jgi:hypothetical protein
MHEIEIQSLDILEEDAAPKLTSDYSVEYINAASDAAKANRFLITLVNLKSREERLLDLLIDSDRFIDIAQEVRKHFSCEWEFFEIIAPDEPF